MPKSKTYEEFVEKFRPKHTTDDCFTPENVYAVVRDWAVKKYHITGEIVRPFWPGEDYTKAEYPDGCCVIDNPPFSICKKIVDWYNAHGVRFFLFCPGLTSLAIAKNDNTTFVSVGSTITFENGAKVNVGFVTNLSEGVLCETAPDLHDAIKRIDKQNQKIGKIHAPKFRYADGILTSGRLNYLAVHNTPFRILKDEAVVVRDLDCGMKLYGSGLLISCGDRLAAAERAAAHVIELSEREKNIIKQLKG